MKWTLLMGLALIALSNADDNAVASGWTGCWTAFVTIKGMCHKEYGAEYEAVESEGCGILNLGRRALCKQNFAGCKLTQCLPPRGVGNDVCEKFLKDGPPVLKDSIKSCGHFDVTFRQYRCCPKQE